MTLASFLVGLVGPMATRLLVALGVSLVTLTGVVASVTALRSAMLSSIGALPAGGIQLLGLFGVWEALGMILGTYTFLLTFKSTAGFKALVKT